MKKNYMKEVANLLGLEIEEEFKIKGFEGFNNHTFKLNDNTLLCKAPGLDKWFRSPALDALLNGTFEIEKPILNKKEKEYLSAVIRPFRDKIFGIAKHTLYTDKHEYLTISLTEETGDHFHMSLPSFKANTMYKGMTIDKKYTLEELDI